MASTREFNQRHALDAEQRAKDLATLTPTTLSTGTGTSMFGTNESGGFDVSSQLDPRLAQLSQNLFGQASNMFNQADIGGVGQGIQQLQQTGRGFLQAASNFDPFAAAQTQFGRITDALAPQRQRDQQSLDARLLGQGRLGINANGQGSPEQLAMQTAIQESNAGNFASSLGQAQSLQQGMFNQGLGALGLGGQMSSGLFSGGLNSVQGGLNLEQLPMQQLSQLGAFSGIGNDVNLSSLPAIFNTPQIIAGTPQGQNNSFGSIFKRNFARSLGTSLGGGGE